MTPSLWVHANVVARLVSLPPRPWEVGGWLLGFWTADEQQLFVTHATPPASRGTPRGVYISARGHRARFDAAWEASAGHATFLGDWHTHPGGVAKPSARDRRAAQKLATNPDFGTPRPLLGIVSTARWPWRKSAGHVRWHLGDENDPPMELVSVITRNLPEEVRDVPTWAWPNVRRGQRKRRTLSHP